MIHFLRNLVYIYKTHTLVHLHIDEYHRLLRIVYKKANPPTLIPNSHLQSGESFFIYTDYATLFLKTL